MKDEDLEFLKIVSALSASPSVTFSKMCKSAFKEKFLEISEKYDTKKPRQILFLALNKQPVCQQCKINKVPWRQTKYQTYCGIKCSSNSTKTKEQRISTTLEKYGVKNISELESVKEKRKDSMLLKYGVPHALQSDDFRAKAKETNIERYGVENPMQNSSVQAKAKETNIERYGVENPMQNSSVQAKAKETTYRNFGVDFPSQNSSVQAKAKETNIERYGVENPMQNSSVQAKAKETNIERYGVEYPSQSRLIKEKLIEKNIRTYGVTHRMKLSKFKHQLSNVWKQKYNKENPNQRNFSNIAKSIINDDITFQQYAKTMTAYELSKLCNVGISTIYVKMAKLGITNYAKHSTFEKILISFIEDHYKGTIILNDRTVLNGKELDIYLPEIKVAIECNGTYWHSEKNGKGVDYHSSKTIVCRNKGINLTHVWLHEWETKSDIIKSMLINKLGFTVKRIYARTTTISEITNTEANEFYESNHMQGSVVGAKINYGLFNNLGELVSAMSFGKPRFNKTYQWELLRLATKLNTVVIGGASKMFNRFIKNYSPDTVLSYANRMYTNGNVYYRLGFSFAGVSSPGYRYTKNYSETFSRHKFQKHKLSRVLINYDPGLSESENMNANGYDKIYDSGNDIFVWKTK